jgi:hypothetical protein
MKMFWNGLIKEVMKMFWMCAAKLAQEKAGLYDGDSYKGLMGLMDAIDWINAEGIDGGNYRIVLRKDEAIPYVILEFRDKQVSVSLKGVGWKKHRVRWECGSDRPLFTVGTGVTFTLEDGVALVGMSESKSSLVVVERGTFNMSGGSISGNLIESGSGGGVCVQGGTFNMSGGSISGNLIESGSDFLTAEFGVMGSLCGGGVFIIGERATFIKSRGGVIYGSNASAKQANTANRGAAVYCYGSRRKRDTTARVNTVMDSTKAGTAGGWE